MLVNAISLEPFPQLTLNLKFVFKLSRGLRLLILGHLLQTSWPPSNFFNVCNVKAMDTACERYIFRIISSIDFKIEL